MRIKFHSLGKPKLRQSWHKYNLFNLSRAKIPGGVNRTLYQQKWTAKALTRSYHGEQIQEKKWQRMFRPYLASVIPVRHQELAKSDGSEYAAGRGSGVEMKETPKFAKRTPYMQMTFAPIERRLDTAIFRALFASSTRQARQFVVHGDVKVNGKKMIHPGYLLNPGDMFQVDPDRVLYATGARKDPVQRRAGRVTLRKQKTKASDETPPAPIEAESTPTDAPEGSMPETSEPSEQARKPQLKDLRERARALLEASRDKLPARAKRELREFQRSVRLALSSSADSSKSPTATSLEQELESILAGNKSTLSTSSSSSPSSSSSSSSPSPPTSTTRSTLTETKSDREDESLLRDALRLSRDNPIDSTKPYATPWRPRDYMSAFAFIPRFLEVNQNICSAVYLRHPVARPGLAEVPSPYGHDSHLLAFSWYLRRR
ncbi:MAG: hypothetical protein M1825_004495 [Sarcosagium campestre]|nr:MAG: hypothetical protein M1825_004495 [Sarcosagium campestre]